MQWFVDHHRIVRPILDDVVYYLHKNLEALIKLNTFLRVSDRENIFSMAANIEKIDVIQFLYPYVKASDFTVKNAFIHAYLYAKIDLINYLLRQDYDLYYKCKDEIFHIAAFTGKLDIVEQLVFEVPNNIIQESFVSAARCGAENVVRWLIDNCSIPDETKAAALKSAVSCGIQRKSIVLFLLSQGAKPDPDLVIPFLLKLNKL